MKPIRLASFLALSMLFFGAALCFAQTDVVKSVFGVGARTPYCALYQGQYRLTAYFQDVFSGPYILRYTTPDCPFGNTCSGGNQSVYQQSGSQIQVVKEDAISSDHYGNPVCITGETVYSPPQVFGPTTIATDNVAVWNSTSGTWTNTQEPWPPKLTQPCDPLQNPTPGTYSQYQTSLNSDGTTLHVWEYYSGNDGTSQVHFYYDAVPVGQVPSRPTLQSFFNVQTNTWSYRFTSIGPDGVCTGQY